MRADFWAGYISGAAGIIVGNPLDLIKTRLQAGQVPHGAHPTSVASLKGTFVNAGTLVKGAAAPILGYGALNALLFVTYNRSLALLAGPNATPTYLQTYVAGALGGLATFVVSTPTELIKVKAQLAQESSSTQGLASSRLSSLGIAKEIWKKEGLRGLYLGGSVTAWRDSVGYGFYFCAYNLSKQLMASSDDPKAERLEQWKILLCGGMAGIVTWASIFPLDVVKTRVQSQISAGVAALPPVSQSVRSSIERTSSSPLGSTTSYGAVVNRTENSSIRSRQPSQSTTSESVAQRRSARAITASMYRAEGLSVFFRGLGVCSVRAFIVNAVQWAVYEWVMVFLSPSKPNHGV